MFSSFAFHLAVVSSLLLLRLLAFQLRPSSPTARARLQSARETIDSATLTLFVLFFLIQPFVAQAYVIPSGSMENSLPVGTRILTSPLASKVVPVEAGEALVFYPPHEALEMANQEEGEVWIKRCIGTPGQLIEIKKNVLWRDGKVVAEPYAIWSSPGLPSLVYDLKIVGGAVYSRQYDAVGRAGLWTQAGILQPDQDAISSATPGRVPADKFLMLGDHRNDSLDGHIWGFLDRDSIVGRAFVSFWPPKQMGIIQR